jgi:hypothetical protein
MNGVDAALTIALFVTLLLAVAAGGFLAARNPAFWYTLTSAVISAALPKIIEYITRRNTPEVEARMQECIRRGGTWDNFKKRCK